MQEHPLKTQNKTAVQTERNSQPDSHSHACTFAIQWYDKTRHVHRMWIVYVVQNTIRAQYQHTCTNHWAARTQRTLCVLEESGDRQAAAAASAATTSLFVCYLRFVNQLIEIILLLRTLLTVCCWNDNNSKDNDDEILLFCRFGSRSFLLL